MTSDRWHALVVEDDPDAAALAAHQMKSIGAESVRIAPSLATAVDAVNHTRPDVIVADLGLDDAYGAEAVEVLSDLAPEATVIVLTGSRSESITIEALAAGAQDVVVKGDGDDLRVVVQRSRVRQKRLIARVV